MVNCVIQDNDIRVGKRKSCGYCPVAYALKRVFARNDITVTANYAFVGEYILELPPHVEKFINDFDKKLLVRSIEFQFPDPPKELTFKSDASR